VNLRDQGGAGAGRPDARNHSEVPTLVFPLYNCLVWFGLVWFTLLNYLSLFNLHLDKICLFCFSTLKLNFDFKFFEGISSTTICV
jgi:hypothetical protein